MNKYTFPTQLILLVLFCLFSVGCNTTNSKNQATTVDEQDEYYKLLDSLGVLKAYIDNKWTMYCVYCDDTAKRAINLDSIYNSQKTYGELPLKIALVEYPKPNKIAISNLFYLNDTTILDFYDTKEISVLGCVIEFNSDTLLHLIGSGISYLFIRCDTNYYSHEDCPERSVNPLQPEVIEYIRNNKEKLNPWFRKEAIKRGVIEEN